MRLINGNDYQGNYFSYGEGSRFNPTHDGSMCDDNALAISEPQRREKEQLRAKLTLEKARWEEKQKKKWAKLKRSLEKGNTVKGIER